MNESSHLAPRAYRYPLVAPVVYRRQGRRQWSQGVSVNMSRTGVLFATAEQVLPAGERIEFRIRLPNPHGARGCEVQCVGAVMRSMPGRYAGEPGAMGVEIEQYELKGVPGEGVRPVRVGEEDRTLASRRRQDD